MDVFESVVRLEAFIENRKTIAGLDVVRLAVRHWRRRREILVSYIRKLRNHFWCLSVPDHVSGTDPLSEVAASGADLIAVSGTADLKSIQLVGFDKHVDQPRPAIVDISRVSTACRISNAWRRESW